MCLNQVGTGGNGGIYRLPKNSESRYTHWGRVGRTCFGDRNHVHLKKAFPKRPTEVVVFAACEVTTLVTRLDMLPVRMETGHN